VMQSDLLSILDQVGTNELGITLPVRVVVSNILAEIILTFVGDVHRVLRKDGLFIASGIITAKEKMVADELERTGFEIVARNEEGDWVALAARKR